MSAHCNIGPRGASARLRAVAASPPIPRNIAILLAIGSFSLTWLPGCTLTPPGAKVEQARMETAGRPYETPFEARSLPDLPAAPTWRDVLQRAFLANGDLEASYFEWKASVQRIEMASAYPNSNVMLGYSYMFSSERMKTFDRQTFSLGFDPAMNLWFPTKVQQKGRVALDEARASGERFRAAKFDLQQRVLSAWADYELLAERRRIQRQQVALSRLAIDAVQAQARAEGVQRDLLQSHATFRTLENSLMNTEVELTASRAMLNGMLGRRPDAPLEPSAPEARELKAQDDQILAAAVDRNPEIGSLAQQVQGRTDALELARMQWIPDINPSFMFTGGVSQALGAAVMLPTTIAEIRGGIREAQAMLRAGEAMLRQLRSDRVGTLVATLVALRNSERQAQFFETTLLPLAQRVRTNAQQSYAVGAGMYLDLIEAQSMVLDTQLMIAEAKAAREQRLAEIEALMGADIETVAPASATPNPSATHNPITADSMTIGYQEDHHDR